MSALQHSFSSANATVTKRIVRNPGPVNIESVSVCETSGTGTIDSMCHHGLARRSTSALRLVPFTAADLPVSEPWFDDVETRRWLGDRRWPSMILRLAASPPAEHREHRVLDRRAWVVEEDGAPAGLVDVEVYEDRTAGLAFVVAPARRCGGVGRRALQAIAEQLAADGVQEVFARAEADNAASIRCMDSAGFRRRSHEPDAEGFLYLARRLNNATM